MREHYVDARELAKLMAVSVSTIKRMTAAGMPSESWGMSRTRRYLPSAAIEWARTTDAGTRDLSTLEVDPERRTNADSGTDSHQGA